MHTQLFGLSTSLPVGSSKLPLIDLVNLFADESSAEAKFALLDADPALLPVVFVILPVYLLVGRYLKADFITTYVCGY